MYTYVDIFNINCSEQKLGTYLIKLGAIKQKYQLNE